MTFLLPAELLGGADRSGLQTAERGARTSGTPFISFYTPAEMLALAREAGFADARHVPERCSPSATSPIGPTASARPAGRTCWWPPPDAY